MNKGIELRGREKQIILTTLQSYVKILKQDFS